MTEAQIRAATVADFDAIFDLYNELAGDRGAPVGEAGQQRLRDILDHPGTVILGADFAGRLVSVASMHVLPNLTFHGRPYALVENVVTLRAFQRQGLARAVMTEIRNRAWDVGCYKIMLLTGRRLGAREFYERLGYTADDKWGMTLRCAAARQPRH